MGVCVWGGGYPFDARVEHEAAAHQQLPKVLNVDAGAAVAGEVDACQASGRGPWAAAVAIAALQQVPAERSSWMESSAYLLAGAGE